MRADTLTASPSYLWEGGKSAAGEDGGREKAAGYGLSLYLRGRSDSSLVRGAFYIKNGDGKISSPLKICKSIDFRTISRPYTRLNFSTFEIEMQQFI